VGYDSRLWIAISRRSSWCIGTGNTALVQLTDRNVSLRHAELFHRRRQWHLRALEGTPGLRQDGEPRQEFALTPGLEIGIGATILIAESERSIALREFCAGCLGGAMTECARSTTHCERSGSRRPGDLRWSFEGRRSPCC